MQQWLSGMYAGQGQNITPWGAQTSTPGVMIDPITGQEYRSWVNQTVLPEDVQAQLEAQQSAGREQAQFGQGLWGNVEGAYGSPLNDWGQYSPIQNVDPTLSGMQMPRYLEGPGQTGMAQLPGQLQRTGPELDPSQQYYQSAEDAIYGQFERRAEPRMEQEMSALDTALRNQGLTPGDEAYDYQMNQMRQAQDDARLGAQYQATMGAGGEASRMLGMDAATRAQLFGENRDIFSGDMGLAGQQYDMMADQFRQGLSSDQMTNAARNQAFQDALNYGNALYGQQIGSAGLSGANREQQIAEELMRRDRPYAEYQSVMPGQIPQGGMPGAGGGYGGGPQLMDAYNNAFNQNAAQQSAQMAGNQNYLNLGLNAVGALGGWFGGGGGGGGTPTQPTGTFNSASNFTSPTTGYWGQPGQY
jgi:hypothetical protein